MSTGHSLLASVQSTTSEVLFHITGNGLNVWSTIIVGELVTREESQRVRVAVESTDGSKDVLRRGGSPHPWDTLLVVSTNCWDAREEERFKASL